MSKEQKFKTEAREAILFSLRVELRAAQALLEQETFLAGPGGAHRRGRHLAAQHLMPIAAARVDELLKLVAEYEGKRL